MQPKNPANELDSKVINVPEGSQNETFFTSFDQKMTSGSNYTVFVETISDDKTARSANFNTRLCELHSIQNGFERLSLIFLSIMHLWLWKISNCYRIVDQLLTNVTTNFCQVFPPNTTVSALDTTPTTVTVRLQVPPVNVDRFNVSIALRTRPNETIRFDANPSSDDIKFHWACAWYCWFYVGSWKLFLLETFLPPLRT